MTFFSTTGTSVYIIKNTENANGIHLLNYITDLLLAHFAETQFQFAYYVQPVNRSINVQSINLVFLHQISYRYRSVTVQPPSRNTGLLSDEFILISNKL
jgi:hypothetical protein